MKLISAKKGTYSNIYVFEYNGAVAEVRAKKLPKGFIKVGTKVEELGWGKLFTLNELFSTFRWYNYDVEATLKKLRREAKRKDYWHKYDAWVRTIPINVEYELFGIRFIALYNSVAVPIVYFFIDNALLYTMHSTFARMLAHLERDTYEKILNHVDYVEVVTGIGSWPQKTFSILIEKGIVRKEFIDEIYRAVKLQKLLLADIRDQKKFIKDVFESYLRDRYGKCEEREEDNRV